MSKRGLRTALALDCQTTPAIGYATRVAPRVVPEA